MSDQPDTADNPDATTAAAAAEQASPEVIVVDMPDAMTVLTGVRVDLLRAYFAACRAEGKPLRVDVPAGPGMWDTAVAVSVDEPGDEPDGDQGADPWPDKALVELDATGERRHVPLTDIRPHTPCWYNGPESTHPAGDVRWCQHAVARG